MRVRIAFETLRDPIRRRAYDVQIGRREEGQDRVESLHQDSHPLRASQLWLAARDQIVRTATRRIWINGAIAAAGGLFSYLSYESAPGGGTYVFFIGAGVPALRLLLIGNSLNGFSQLVGRPNGNTSVPRAE